MQGKSNDQLIEVNRREYGEAYESLHFVTEERAAKAAEERREWLAALRDRAVFCCKNTKLDGRNLSPGCQTCVKGTWSCLFINGRCNSRCFYCPSRQDEDSVPATNSLPFPRVDDYIDYVRKLGFTGVSFSGGEPLMILDDTLRYLSAVKREFGDTVHTWLYTNGTLSNRETLLKLREAGLNEIRFDIGATGFSLEAARRAVDAIDTVTVEIPAIPEEFEVMKEKIAEMESAGIRHLNLHQLRLTPYNLPHVARRGYTFLHGERVTVLESEQAALRLILWAYDTGVRLPINYCSFVYKNRFQNAAARRNSAAFIRKSYEDITEKGYIRTLELAGTPDDLNRQKELFRQSGNDERYWALSYKKDTLYTAASLWPLVDPSLFRIFVSYAETKLLPALTYRNLFAEVRLNSQRSLYVERAPISEKIEIDRDCFERLRQSVLHGNESIPPGNPDPIWDRVRFYETIESELGDYF